MSWEPRSYKGEKVWVRVDESGDLILENNRVHMKKQEDQSNYYQASPDNVSLLAEDFDDENPVGDERIEIYTDGSSTAAHQQGGPTGIGVVLRSREGFRELSEPAGEGNNITAELDAIRLALETVSQRERPVRLHTDSEYAVKALTQWVDGWRENNWEKSDGDPVSHQERLKEILSLMDQYDDLELNWVEGHAGHVFNERADTLAARAAEEDGS
jgi:ribonuclease HI